MMVIFLLKIIPLQSMRRELLEILRSVVGPTSIQPGCQACGIYEGSGEDQAVLYLEQWDSLNTIQRHIQSARFAKILAAMEMSTMQPELRFCETSQIWGMNLIESLRGPQCLHQPSPFSSSVNNMENQTKPIQEDGK